MFCILDGWNFQLENHYLKYKLSYLSTKRVWTRTRTDPVVRRTLTSRLFLNKRLRNKTWLKQNKNWQQRVKERISDNLWFINYDSYHLSEPEVGRKQTGSDKWFCNSIIKCNQNFIKICRMTSYVWLIFYVCYILYTTV